MKKASAVTIWKNTRDILDLYLDEKEVKDKYPKIVDFVDAAVREKIERDSGVDLGDLINE